MALAVLTLNILVFSSSKRSRLILGVVSLCCRLILRLIGVRTVVKKHLNSALGRSRLILCNHMSYLDAVILYAIKPARFVTSQEIAETPVLGFIARVGQCLFVERRLRMRVLQDIATIVTTIHQGDDVMIFPEGTTGTGFEPLPIKSSLLAASSRVRSRPLLLRLTYTEVDNQPYTKKNAALVAWYGDMTFMPHLWRLLRCWSIVAKLEVLPEPDLGKASGRKELAQYLAHSWHGSERVNSHTPQGHRSNTFLL
jgi:1-acyl-sn-glycerol-3-phosphate acyltransferase